MKRPVAAIVALGIAVAVLAPGLAGDDAPARLARALAKMDSLPVRVAMDATVEATGPTAAGGTLATRVHVDGQLAPPDRARLAVEAAGRHQEIVVVGERTWVDDGAGFHQSVRLALGPLRDAMAPLGFIRGPGAARFAGYGILAGAPTYRVRIDLRAAELAARTLAPGVSADAKGTIEVEIGLFDDLLRSQTVEITESGEELGTGLAAVHTRWRIDYRDHGRPIDVREPDSALDPGPNAAGDRALALGEPQPARRRLNR